MTTQSSTPAGWYPAPEGPFERYWDGGRWTDETRPMTPVGTSTARTKPEKKKRRIFLWVFLAIQLIFLIWVIAGASSGAGQPNDCSSLSAKTCNDAADTGTAIGVFLIIVFWCFVDFLLAVGYVIYRVAKRP